MPTSNTLRSALAVPLVAFLMAVFAFGAVTAPAQAADDPLLAPPGRCAQDANPSADLWNQRNAIFCLINHARRTAGLRPLACYGNYNECRGTEQNYTMRLAKSSVNKAFDVMKCPRDPHRACGRPWTHWMTYFQYPFRYAGENIAIRFFTARATMAFWLSQADSRRVLLSAFSEMAVGIVRAPGSSARGTWVAHFGVRAKKLGKAKPGCTNADTLVTQLTREQAEASVLCLTNEKRAAHGVPALTHNANLVASARSHADKSVRLRWWSPTDGNVSHDDPEIANEQGKTDDIGLRVRSAGYCPSRGWWTSENTFSSANSSPQTNVGARIHPPTPRGAVEWWYTHLGPDGTLATNDHRKTMLDPKYRELGVGVARGSAFPQDVGGLPAGTFVQNYGTCG